MAQRNNENSNGKSANLRRIGQREAARMMNVSRRSVQYATEVLKKGIPELTEQVWQGNLKVSTAAMISRLPKEKQREIIAKDKSEIKRVVKAMQAKKKPIVKLLRDYADKLVIATSDSHTKILNGDKHALAPVLEIVQKLRDDAEDIEDGKLNINHLIKHLE